MGLIDDDDWIWMISMDGAKCNNTYFVSLGVGLEVFVRLGVQIVCIHYTSNVASSRDSKWPNSSKHITFEYRIDIGIYRDI